MRAGPRGSRLHVESAQAIPLVWLDIVVRGGSAADPPGKEGFHHHLLELTRRGAGGRPRDQLDEAIDALGASLEVSTSRDWVKLSGLCLSRNLDQLVALAANVLAAPAMDAGEHTRLIGETRATLDDLRDDDASLAARFFARSCAPGHPYSRTAMGNEASLARLDLEELRAAHTQTIVPGNLVIGLAGDVEEAQGQELAARLVAELPDRAPPPLPDVGAVVPVAERRVVVVDKPGRSQAQVLIGHQAPPYGSEDHCLLLPIETAFGGTFTARLMQAIRVERGWSYGAGCVLDRARGPYWFHIHLASATDVAPDAISLALSLFEDITTNGITREELDFARSYLAGNFAFRLATPRQRLRIATESELFGLPADFAARLPERLSGITLEAANDAARRCFAPDRALIVVVATADSMVPRLESLGLGAIEVARFDSY